MKIIQTNQRAGLGASGNETLAGDNHVARRGLQNHNPSGDGHQQQPQQSVTIVGPGNRVRHQVAWAYYRQDENQPRPYGRQLAPPGRGRRCDIRFGGRHLRIRCHLKPQLQTELQFTAGTRTGYSARIFTHPILVEDGHALHGWQIKVRSVKQVEGFEAEVNLRAIA